MSYGGYRPADNRQALTQNAYMRKPVVDRALLSVEQIPDPHYREAIRGCLLTFVSLVGDLSLNIDTLGDRIEGLTDRVDELATQLDKAGAN